MTKFAQKLATRRPSGSSVGSPPTANPTLIDHLRSGGQSAKPPTGGRSTGRLPQNTRK